MENCQTVIQGHYQFKDVKLTAHELLKKMKRDTTRGDTNEW